MLNRVLMTEIIFGWQHRLYLSAWTIKIDWDNLIDEDDAFASIWRARDYKDAKIRFNENWEKWTWQEANQHVVHELLHLVSQDVEFALDALDGQLHRDADSVFESYFKHSFEAFIDDIAKRLVELGGCIDAPSHSSIINKPAQDCEK